MTWKPDYADPELVKSYLDIQNNSRDAFIALWITTVSRNVDDFCGRQFGKAGEAQTRYYTPTYDRAERAWYAEIDDVQDVTGLSITDEDGTAITDYVLLPRNAAANGVPYERVKVSVEAAEIAVEALFGWNAVPASVPTGLLLQAARLNARVDSPFGIAGSPAEGTEIRLLAQLDPDFKTSLKPYVRKWWTA